MLVYYDDDEENHGPPPRLDPGRPFDFLHGLWRDEVRGSTICIDGRHDRPRVVYCFGGDHELTGRYIDWRFERGQFMALFRWLRQPIAGYAVLQPDTQNSMHGGWWYHKDVPWERSLRLPFLPGVNPSRWIRQDPRRPWPLWACEKLDLPTDGSVTSESLLSTAATATTADTSTALAPADLARTVELPPTNAIRIPPERTSEGRYRLRVALWTGGRGGLARLVARARHHGWWLLHNLVAHPLLALSAGKLAVALHDWTSRRLNRDDALEPSPPPVIERRFWWIVHNLATHPAIGLVPCATTFRWHDATARRMRVAGWV